MKKVKNVSKATGPVYKVPFRRRRKNLTNYAKRLALLKSGLPRLVVRKSNKGIVVQIISFTDKGDKTEASANAKELEQYGWVVQSNLPTAYLTGLLCAKKVLKKGVKNAVFDMGLTKPTKASVPFAALKGVVDAGVEIPHNPEVFDNERFSGKHVADYAKKIKDTAAYQKQFSVYLKKGISPENISDLFESVKSKLQKS